MIKMNAVFGYPQWSSGEFIKNNGRDLIVYIVYV